MKLITRQSLVEDVAERFRAQYNDRMDKVSMHGQKTTYKEMHESLCAVTTEDEVVNIIGNRAWTFIACSECGVESGTAIQLGDHYHDEEDQILLCIPCIEKALALACEAKYTLKPGDQILHPDCSGGPLVHVKTGESMLKSG